jgi:exodeoxyribonuclease VII large subunit
MPDTYLDVPFKDKDQAKALGARWDAAARKWYAPDGKDVALFKTWLPAAVRADVTARRAPSAPVPASEAAGAALPAPAGKGIALSQLLAGVAAAVAQAFKAGVWTLVEVVEARTRNGHVYLEVSERDAEGGIVAKANATIWARTANAILPAFEKATGASLAPGIKLLVRARPVYKPQYGFSLDIDAIDPEYTLGDLEARKREIRTRLTQEGLFDANRRLPAPWDYRAVLVVAPQGAAGLGDFQAEAKRLERCGVCRFVYALSRFQGEGAAAQIREALLAALADWRASGAPGPDAVAIIRGGGAVNDLAWLNDYALARALCELPVPVLTGIGHERDSTILDEVANLRFDTPSKVAAGIEQVIKKRAQEARDAFELIAKSARRTLDATRAQAERRLLAVQADAARHVAHARQATHEAMAGIRLESTRTLHTAGEDTRALLAELRHQAHRQLSDARRDLPALISELRLEALAAVRTARALADARLDAVRDRALVDVRRSREATDQQLRALTLFARRGVADAAAGATALFREIAGQGPEKTLGRGFAIVRDAAGRPLTRAAQCAPGAAIDIQFGDGRIAAQVNTNAKDPT